MLVFQTALARRIVTLLAFVVLVGSGTAIAQQQVIPDSLWVTLDDDTSSLARINGQGQIFPAEWFVSGYKFQMYADSTCETDYEITAFKVNDHRWKLRNWKKRRTINAEADILSYNSRTVDTTLHAGDVVSFARNLSWCDPRVGMTDTNNYKSFDTLTYAVELVRSSDSARIALLDSIGMMPRVTTGAPTIFGMRPIIALVDWTVPASIDSVRAFIRVRVRAHGSGEYHFTRSETIRVHKWRQPPAQVWVDYLKYLGQDYAGKPVVSTTESAATSGLLAIRATGDGNSMTADFATAPNGGSTSVAIYDGAGRLLFSPYSSPASEGRREQITHRFESSGLYIVCLLHDGRLVATRTITMGR